MKPKDDEIIEIFESEYTFDTPQERKLVLRDFADTIRQQTAQEIFKDLDIEFSGCLNPNLFLLCNEHFRNIQKIKQKYLGGKE